MINKIKGLKWSPWVGVNYDKLPANNKVLFIGESHYLNNTEQSIVKHNDPKWTQIVLAEQGVNREYYSKFFKGLHKMFFGNEDFDSKKFWSNLSFYNFIQRPMGTVEKRPSKNDKVLAWDVFEKVIGELEPRYCVFWGLKMADYFNHLSVENDGIHYIEKIGNNESRGSKLTLPNGKKVDLIFVKHPSRLSNIEKWKDYLQHQMGDTYSFLLDASQNNNS